MPIERDMRRSVTPTLIRSFSLIIFVMRVNKAMIPTKPSIPTAALPIDSNDMVPSNFATTANIATAPAIARRVFPIWLPLFILVISTNKAIIPVKPRRPAPALSISDHSIEARSSTTKVKINIAPAILTRTEPRSDTSFFCILVMSVNKAIIPVKPRRPAPALPISGHVIEAIIFATSAKISIAAAILKIAVPALFALSPIIEISINNFSIAATATIIPIIALTNCPTDMLPNIFIAATRMSSDAPILRITRANAAILFVSPPPSFPAATESTATTTASPASIPAILSNAVIAVLSLSGSISVKTTIAPTSIRIAVAIETNAFALILKETDFITPAKDLTTLENDFTTLAVLFNILPTPFAERASTCPTPDKTSPTPSIGEASLSKIPIILLTIFNKPIELIPEISPIIIFLPISINSVEGE